MNEAPPVKRTLRPFQSTAFSSRYLIWISQNHIVGLLRIWGMSSEIKPVRMSICALRFLNDLVTKHQRVHLRAQETVERLRGPVDDRLVFIERCVEKNGDPGQVF